jgi:hypothetical protein
MNSLCSEEEDRADLLAFLSQVPLFILPFIYRSNHPWIYSNIFQVQVLASSLYLKVREES